MIIIYIGAIFCALITAIALLRTKTPYHLFADRQLAIFLLAASYCVFLYVLVDSGEIVNFPHFFKTAGPVNFILPPLSYLYVRAVLKNEAKFKKTDWLHGIPFVIILFNYLPFYFYSSTAKIEIIANIGVDKWNGTGFINENLQFILREIQVIFYIFFQWKLILQFNGTSLFRSFRAHTQQVLSWIRAFSGIYTLHFICIVMATIVYSLPIKDVWQKEFIDACDIIFGLSFFFLSSYLLLNPAVLYGLPFKHYGLEEDSNKNSNDLEKKKNVSEFDSLLNELENYFEEKKPFLKQGLSISEIAMALNISQRTISFILNNHLGLRFNDFVNSYRIKYIINELGVDYLNNYTLDSLAKESGFSSARTLHRAFIKEYNVPPAEYIANTLNK